jgi:hypothetical protein
MYEGYNPWQKRWISDLEVVEVTMDFGRDTRRRLGCGFGGGIVLLRWGDGAERRKRVGVLVRD